MNTAKAFLLCAFLLALPVAVEAQFKFTTNAGVITITAYTGAGGAVVIPATTNGRPVVAIGDYAFNSKSSITSVTIPDGVTNIGSGAFDSCANLASVSIPASVAGIGDYAFEQCSSLNHVTIPSGVATIRSHAFYFCSSLNDVTIPASVTSIEGDAFSYTALVNVSLPGSLGSLGDYAFSACGALVSISLPATVTSIGTGVLSPCNSLTNISVDALNNFYSSAGGVLFDKNQRILIQCPGAKGGVYAIPGSVTNIADNAFAFCTALTGVTIPNGVTTIGSSAFNGTSLTTMVLPGSLTAIGSGAFSSTSIATITIPAGVTNIGSGAFAFCANLVSVYFLGNAVPEDQFMFFGDNATIYYLATASGWGASFSGLPTAVWNAVVWNAVIQSAGAQNNRFGFNIVGAADLPIVVEASTNLASASWTTLLNCTLTNGSIYFSDAASAGLPARIYRLRQP